MLDVAAAGPRISVVIPTYNRATLIGVTLDAVLGQTRPPDEIIVVDDGSTDTTDAVLARYGGQIRTLRIANSGDLAARNHGLRQATYDLVAFCDSDDLWRPGFLAAMATLWQTEPSTRVAFSNFVILRDDAWQTADKFADAPPGYWDALRPLAPDLAVFDQPIVERLIHFQPFFPSCMVADRDFLLSVGGWDEAVSRTIGTDFATALRVAEYAPFGVVRTPLVGIRKHAGNFSADVQAMNLGDARILEHVLGSRPALAALAPVIEASIVQRRKQALETAFARGDFAAVRSIRDLLPATARGGKLRIKTLVADLPAPLRQAAATLLLRLGSLQSKVGG